MKEILRTLRGRIGSARRCVRAALLLLPLLALCALPARADDPGNNDDSIVIRITPRIDYGVIIDTASVDLDFTMDMGATDYTLIPATVTIVGNIRPVELDIEAANVSAAPVWTLDTDETAGLDELQLYGLFSVGRSTQPLESEFSGAKNLIISTPKRAGQENGNGADQNFENNVMEGGADVDLMNIGDQRQLWLRIDAPPYTSTGDEQKFQITVTATRTDM